MNKNKIRFFTLIEVMVALFIGSLSAIAIYSTILLVNHVMIESRVRLEAQRVSYDFATRLYKMSRSELEDDFDADEGLFEFAVLNSDDYIMPDTRKIADDYLDLTPDLRLYSGFVQCFFTNIVNPDTNSNNQQWGYQIDVSVQWSLNSDDEDSPAYTTTVYKYFAE